jgi:capsular polysaccharide biosynthesis protein
MTDQALDLRRSAQIVRRHKVLMGVIVALGLLAGGAYAVLYPPTLTSTALVVLPQTSAAADGAAATANGGPDPYTATQEVIADSTQVLSDALPEVRPVMSLDELRHDVQIGSLTPYILSVTAKSRVAADAEATANAVASSYVNFIGSASSAVGRVSAQVLQPAISAGGTAPLEQLIIYVLAGAIGGALIGVIVSLAISRSDRHLRERDEIANSVGIPVLASFPVSHPTNAAGWTKLLEGYKPEALPALQLRRALQQLQIAAHNRNNGSENGRWSIAVLSLSSDPGAIALGPQLAVYAASQGIPTALVIGQQQDVGAVAALRTACAARSPSSSKRPDYLQVVVSDGHAAVRRDVLLTVVVLVVDDRSPQVPDTTRTTATVLGVSAGVATAEQLARVAVGVDTADREVTGILVADPDPADQTTGRLPQLARREQWRMPTRMTGITTEIRK